MHDLSVFKTGVLWTGPLKAVREVVPLSSMLFNEPWMNNVRTELLFRYWKRKGCPGILQTWMKGCRVYHRAVEGNTIISWMESPEFIKMNYPKPAYTAPWIKDAFKADKTNLKPGLRSYLSELLGSIIVPKKEGGIW